MSFSEYSLCTMDNWRGVPIAFAGFDAAENNGISFGGFNHKMVTL